MKATFVLLGVICCLTLMTVCRGTHAARETMPPPTPPPAAAGRLDLRVLSFNIRYGTAEDGDNRWEKRRDIAFDVIRDYRPEVIGLQEALRFQIDEIRAAFPVYEEIGVGRDDGRTAGEYSVILYRRDKLKVAASDTFWLSTPDKRKEPGSLHPSARIPRICTWGLFEDLASGERVYLYNTHFDHESQEAREYSAVAITQAFASEQPSAGRIVLGDFNAGEANPAVRHLKGLIDLSTGSTGAPATPRLMEDTFRVLNPYERHVGTYHAFSGKTDGEKIDFVLASPAWKVLQASIVHHAREGRYPSDHFPVFARVVVQK